VTVSNHNIGAVQKEIDQLEKELIEVRIKMAENSGRFSDEQEPKH